MSSKPQRHRRSPTPPEGWPAGRQAINDTEHSVIWHHLVPVRSCRLIDGTMAYFYSLNTSKDVCPRPPKSKNREVSLHYLWDWPRTGVHKPQAREGCLRTLP